MLRKDKITDKRNSSGCIEKQSGEFTHTDTHKTVERLEQTLFDAFNIEKDTDDKQTLA